LACVTGASACSNSTTATACFSGYTLLGSTCNADASSVLSSANPVTTT